MCDKNANNRSQECETALALQGKSVEACGLQWGFTPGPQRSLRVISTLVNTTQRN